MIDDGWGTVNQVVLREAERVIRRSRRAPATYVQESTELGSSPQPALVAKLLNAAGIDFVIIGAHALGVHTKEPRATADVDVVVSDVPAAVKALRNIQPNTTVLDLGDTVGKRIATAKGAELVDILLPSGGVRGELFSHRIKIILGGQPASIPTLTAMFALKWLAMFSPARSPRKQAQDKVDFIQLIEVHPTANMVAVAKLVGKVSQTLAGQLLRDMMEFKRTGNIKLFGESANM